MTFMFIATFLHVDVHLYTCTNKLDLMVLKTMMLLQILNLSYIFVCHSIIYAGTNENVCVLNCIKYFSLDIHVYM